ncbi:MAG: hypothetical protein U0894_12550 [Pirellulales bacterium]
MQPLVKPGIGADPSTTENIFKTGEGRNYGQYSNKKVDALFEEGLHEFDEEKRAAIFRKIHTILLRRPALHLALLPKRLLRLQQKLRG